MRVFPCAPLNPFELRSERSWEQPNSGVLSKTIPISLTEFRHYAINDAVKASELGARSGMRARFAKATDHIRGTGRRGMTAGALIGSSLRKTHAVEQFLKTRIRAQVVELRQHASENNETVFIFVSCLEGTDRRLLFVEARKGYREMGGSNVLFLGEIL